MAKAQLTTKSGTVVTIEGSRDEVASLVERLTHKTATTKGSNTSGRAVRNTARTKNGLPGLVSGLIADDFFKKPKELGEIKKALEGQGHFYPRTSLSPMLIRLVRKKELRRLKDGKRWTYVG